MTEKLPLTAVGVTRKDQLDAAVGEIREIIFGVMGQFVRTFFAPESSETFVECFFNFSSVLLIIYGVLLCCRRKVVKWTIFIVCAAILLVPFILIKPKLNRVAITK